MKALNAPEFARIRAELDAAREQARLLERWLSEDHNARCAFEHWRRRNGEKK